MPRGRLRVNCNVPFGQHYLLPLLPEFLAQHPEIAVDISLTDRVVDLLEERADVAIRAGPLRRLAAWSRASSGRAAWSIVGSPAYLERHGVAALAGRSCRPQLPGLLLRAAWSTAGHCSTATGRSPT